MPVQPGKLDRRISLEEPAPARNDTGEEVQGWASVATVWAERIPDKGAETFAADQRSARQEVKWRIRWRSGVTAKMTLVFEGTRYQVHDVQELDRRAGLVLTTHALEVSPGSS